MEEQEKTEATESEVKHVAVSLQLKSSRVYVTLDARREGVEVPSEFKDRSMLTLLLGYNMEVPIPDLTVSADGIRATLSFSRDPFLCFIPWEAVYALSVDGKEGILFHNSKPSDVDIGKTRTAAPVLKLV